MNLSEVKMKMLAVLILLCAVFFGCEEEKVLNNSPLYEIGKPIEINYDSAVENSFQDQYFDMDVAFYIPPGISELKNRPFLFTLSTRRNKSVAGSMLSVINKHGMIAVAPRNGNSIQFVAFLKAMIQTEYVDSTQVFLAGFSNGGRDVFELAWSESYKIKGAVLLDPSDIIVGKVADDSNLSVCVVCQDDRVPLYAPDLARMNKEGIRTKMIGVAGQDHFGILSSATAKEKTDCFNFVNK